MPVQTKPSVQVQLRECERLLAEARGDAPSSSSPSTVEEDNRRLRGVNKAQLVEIKKLKDTVEMLEERLASVEVTSLHFLSQVLLL